MDFVGYLYTADEQVEHNGQFETVMHRYLLTQPMNNYVAKTRDPKFAERLGAFVADPTFTTIYNAFKGE
jgi:hypothetical protein